MVDTRSVENCMCMIIFIILAITEMCRFAEEAEKIDESLGHSRSGFPSGQI